MSWLAEKSLKNQWVKYDWWHYTREVYIFLTENEGIKNFQSQIDNALINRNIGFSSDSTISITNIIASTDIIGVIPRAIYEYYRTSLDLKEINIDFTLPSITLYLMYNRASLNNNAFAEYIARISQNII